MKRQGLAFEQSPIFQPSLFSGKSEHKSDSCPLTPPRFSCPNRLIPAARQFIPSKEKTIRRLGINRRSPGISRAKGSHITDPMQPLLQLYAEAQMKRSQNL